MKPLLFTLLLLLSACGPSEPTREDMAGCSHTSKITARDVADCAVERNERDKEQFTGTTRPVR
jgi:hypothetical protein